jgi:hypothetical protein
LVKVVISDHNRNQLVELPYASNVTWRKALNSVGFASFDLPLSDPYATPAYINPKNYVHMFQDNADSTNYAAADWAGQLVNDFQLSPKSGTITISAAGLTDMVEVSIVTNTTLFNGVDVGSSMKYLLTNSDNWSHMGLTEFTTSTRGPTTVSEIFGFGDSTLDDIYSLCKGYAMDFEIRPDFTYGIYQRQGVDNPNLVARYGDQGNIQVDSTMKLVNTELANQTYYTDNSANTVYWANQTSVQYYGPRTVLIQDNQTFSADDALTKAQLYTLKSAFPLYVMDNVSLVDTSLMPFTQIHLGDSILFEAPSLPLLSSFNGLQRILAIEYNDRKRIMNLTLGNALYKVVRGRLQEVRLY